MRKIVLLSLNILIAFAVLLFSCNSDKNESFKTKKYSEYSDLEKMNLKGDVIGYIEYSKDTTFNTFTFINENGNVLYSYVYSPLKNDGSHFYQYTNYTYFNNLLQLQQTQGQGGNNDMFSQHKIYLYSGRNIINIMEFYDGKPWEEISFKYDTLDYPKNEIKKYLYEGNNGILLENNYFWNEGNLDSIISYYGGNIHNKEYFKDGRLIKRININDDGEISENSAIFEYRLDKFNNDVKKYEKDLNGNLIDSTFRIIKYKGDDISYYEKKYIEIQMLAHNLTNKNSSINSNSDNNVVSENNYVAPQVQQKQWVNCRVCHGTGLNICSECGGKGIRECPNCHGRGFYWDAQRSSCNYCGGHGQAQCNQCYGKGNRGSCSSCGGRGQVQE